MIPDSVREATAGALAGAVSKTALAPLDRLKLVVQLRGSISNPNATAKDYEGPWKALVKLIELDGFFALWRGNTSTILIQAGTSALNFMFMDWYKKVATEIVSDDQRLAKSFVSGALAGGSAITLLYPIGLIRTQLALDVGNESRKFSMGMRDVVRHSVSKNGFTSLYRGYGVALVSVSMYRMIHLGGYDYLKTELYTRQHRRLSSAGTVNQLPFWERFLAAQFVSMMASTCHYPLDSVRRRLMMQSDATVKKYRNALHCFQRILHEEGVTGFYRGLGTNYIRSVGAAILLVSYDFFKTLLS